MRKREVKKRKEEREGRGSKRIGRGKREQKERGVSNMRGGGEDKQYEEEGVGREEE